MGESEQKIQKLVQLAKALRDDARVMQETEPVLSFTAITQAARLEELAKKMEAASKAQDEVDKIARMEQLQWLQSVMKRRGVASEQEAPQTE